MQENVYFQPKGGNVAKISVSSGDTVQKGDVLVEMQTSDLEFAKEEAQIRYNQAKLAYNQGGGQDQKYNLQLAKLALDRATEALEPVSYTHLDVYKRQVYRMAAAPSPSTLPKLPWPSTRG